MKDLVRDAVARSRLLEEKHPEVVYYYSYYHYCLARNGNKYVIFNPVMELVFCLLFFKFNSLIYLVFKEAL